MKILYVDMDGVIADFDKEMSILLPHIELGDGDPSTYDERSIAVDGAMKENPELFETLPLIPGAMKAIIDLKQSGLYDIYFLSAPVCAVPESYMGKRIWLKNTFGQWADKRLILTHRKDLCIGDILVDDRFKNGADKFQGEHLHFGGKQYPNWESILKYLLP